MTPKAIKVVTPPMIVQNALILSAWLRGELIVRLKPSKSVSMSGGEFLSWESADAWKELLSESNYCTVP